MRYAVRKILNVATNVYFSKIEVRGLKNLQAAGTKTGCVFAGNHPSGLVDPMVIMSSVDLPMSSIAKHSLFSTPVIGAFVRAMRAVPVMQPYDPGLPPDKQPTAEERQTMNEQMFSTVQERLVDEGFNIVIFPEGTCHSTPQPMSTGAWCSCATSLRLELYPWRQRWWRSSWRWARRRRSSSVVIASCGVTRGCAGSTRP